MATMKHVTFTDSAGTYVTEMDIPDSDPPIQVIQLGGVFYLRSNDEEYRQTAYYFVS